MSDTATTNKPFDEVTDGRLKFTIWRKESEKGPWYQGTIRNRYKDKTTGEWKDTDNIGEDDWLPLAQLAEEAYARVRTQKRADAKARKEKEPETVAA